MDTAFELGAGWGALALPLAGRYGAARVEAYELSPLPWLVCRLRGALTGASNLRVRRADFFRARLSGAFLVVCYLHPGAMARLRPKLEAELREGALVVSNTFAIPGWRPAAEYATPGWFGEGRIYVYRVGATPPGGAEQPGQK